MATISSFLKGYLSDADQETQNMVGGAVEGVAGVLDFADMVSQAGFNAIGVERPIPSPERGFVGAANEYLGVNPNPDSPEYIAASIASGALTGGAGSLRAAGMQGGKQLAKQLGKEVGVETMAYGGGVAGGELGQQVAGDQGEFVGSLVGGLGSGMAGNIALNRNNRNEIFAGTKSETADPMMLEMAVMSENAGKTRIRTWKNTGWFRGADGFWRYEIDDSVAKTKPFGETTPQLPLYSYLQHDELYRAYPQLAELPTRSMTTNEILDDPMTQGFLINNDLGIPKEIAINPMIGLDNQRNTLLHEAQHAVQGYEGHSGGANDATAVRYLDKYSNYRRETELPDDYVSRAVHDASMQVERSALLDAEHVLKYDGFYISRPNQVFSSGPYYDNQDKIYELLGPPPARGPERLQYAKKAGSLISEWALEDVLSTKNAGYRYRVQELLYDALPDARDGRLEDVRRMRRNLEGRIATNRKRGKLDLADEIVAENRDMRTTGLYNIYRSTLGESEAFTTGDRMDYTSSQRRDHFPLTSVARGMPHTIPEDEAMRSAKDLHGGVLRMMNYEDWPEN